MDNTGMPQDGSFQTPCYAAERLSATRALTAEGFLLCENVPISRTGEQLYAPGEILFEDGEEPLQPDHDGLLRVTREPEDVFEDASIASFAGKPVTNEHPTVSGRRIFVTPENYQTFAVGTILNPRRGVGEFEGSVVADLLITEAQAIKDVLAGKIEISCGYESAYEQLMPGRAVQRRIRGNHVALVARGRCGPQCSIGDSMPTPNKEVTAVRKLLQAFGLATDDEAAGLHIHMGGAKDEDKDDKDEKYGAMDKRMTDLEGAITKLADAFGEFAKKGEKETTQDAEPEEEKDEVKKAEAHDSLQDLTARAEILQPGYKIAAPAKVTKKFHDDICGCRRALLKEVAKTADGAKLLEAFVGKAANFDTLPREKIIAAVVGASEIKRAQNNGSPGKHTAKASDFGKAPPTAEELNKKYAAHWASRQG